MRSLIRISHIRSHPFNPQTIFSNISFSTASPNKSHAESDDFLSWLRRKAGCEISSVLSVGFSTHGRALFASESIRSGDCLLKIPYNAQMSTGKIRSEIACLLVDDIDNVSRLAVALLAEKKLGRISGWAPYIQCLPRINEMHNTALDHTPQIFGDFILEDFRHAYALILSRAWRTSKGISLIFLITTALQRQTY